MDVRAATAMDAGALAALGAASFHQAYAGLLPDQDLAAHCARHHTPPAWHALLSTQGVTAWIADGAGYAVLAPPDLPGSGPGDAELKRLYVLAPWHGTGLGRALLGAAAAQAAAQGAGRLVLGVYARNQRARAFYARQGFVPVATRQFQVGSLLCDDLVLARPISPPPPDRDRRPATAR